MKQTRKELRDKRWNGMSAEEITDHFKERIYATITLLALLATLWWNSEHLSHWSAALSVAGTLVALWLATGVSSRMSYQAVNGKQMGVKQYADVLQKHSALLIPGFPALFFILLSGIGLMPLSMALLISMALLLFSFAGFSILAGRQIHSSLWEIIITTIFEVLIGVGIIALKIFAGH